MVFKIGKNNFILSSDRIKYNTLKREFITLSVWAKEEFKRVYKSKILTNEELTKSVREISKSIVEEALIRGYDILQNENINDKNDKLKNEYFKSYYVFDKAYDTFLQSNYKFNNPNLLVLFLNAIEESVINVHEVLALVISEEKPHFVASPVKGEDLNKVDKLYDNLTENEEVIVEILKINPYYERAYKYILNKFGDENNEIENLCNILDIDLQLIKKEVVDEYYKSLKLDNEENSEESLNDFKEFCRFISYDKEEEYILNIIEKIKQHKKDFSTVNGIYFHSREEAVIARMEKQSIEREMKKVKCETEEELVTCRNNILSANYSTIIKENYLSELNERIDISIRKHEEKLLNSAINMDTLNTEEEIVQALDKVKKMTLRNDDLLKKKVLELKGLKENIVANNETQKIEAIINDYVFLSIEKVYEVIEEISELDIKTEGLKENVCEMLSEDADRLVKEHRDLISKAKKYEERNKINRNNSEENIVVTIAKKFFKEKVEEYDKNKEKIEEEAWKYITKDGKRRLEEMEE
ncbi:MAG: hypothetical protein ACRC7N_02765 [Clostridium sp.]